MSLATWTYVLIVLSWVPYFVGGLYLLRHLFWPKKGSSD